MSRADTGDKQRLPSCQAYLLTYLLSVYDQTTMRKVLWLRTTTLTLMMVTHKSVIV